MKNRIFLFFLVNLFFQNASFGCSCITPISFCESMLDSNGDVLAETIIRGRVTNSSSEGKRIKIDQIIYGNSIQSEFNLKYGFCTLYYSELEKGGEYIIALNKSNNNFYLLGCAISFLKIENGVVKGQITSGISSVPYAELANLNGCGEVFQFIGFENNISVFPNPTINQITIKNSNEQVSFEGIQLSIFDASGKELTRFNKVAGILPEESWEINFNGFAAGLYFVKLSGNFQEKYYKIVKL